MRAWLRIPLLVALLLVVASCGDDSTEVTITVIPLTTLTTSTTTTVAPADTLGADPSDPGEALRALAGQLFEDPFMDSGFHEMAWEDERNMLVSLEPLSPSVPQEGLAIAPIVPPPTTSGVGPNQLLVLAWIDGYDGDGFPLAVVLYSLDPDGWQATVAIYSGDVEAALLETTDYDALNPPSAVAVRTSVSFFDWTARIFRAGVTVNEDFDTLELIYQGEIECTITDPLECTTLSDDGVLRPGDEGEDVEALQNDLAALGYLTGTIDGKYGPQTAASVSAFQADYQLTVDGKAGPNTQGLLTDIVGGSSNLILASKTRIGDVVFGTPADTANGELFAIFGSPDASTGWYVDACDGFDWLQSSWDGFTAIYTDRDGFRQLDGWMVEDLSDLPTGLLIGGGIESGWTWSDFDAAGATFNAGYGGFFAMADLGYNNGRFVDPPSDPPAAGAAVKGFGTGTGGFVSC